jgi:hypothetical protein
MSDKNNTDGGSVDSGGKLPSETDQPAPGGNGNCRQAKSLDSTVR